jgi:hypothetical protein
MLGFEIEVDAPVFRKNGTHYETEFKLAVSTEPPGYKIVTDIETRPDDVAYSIFEFVSDPVPVIHAEHRNGRTAVQRQWSTIQDVAKQLAKAERGPMPDLGGRLRLTKAGHDSELRPDFNPDKVATLGVHYTTGLPLGGMPYFFDQLRIAAPVGDGTPHNIRDRFSLDRAQYFSAELVNAFFASHEYTDLDHKRRVARELDGYLQLAYMQICAIADGLDYANDVEDSSDDDDLPLVKNLTAVLCRAPLAELVSRLDFDAFTFLDDNKAAVLNRLTEFQERPEPGYDRPHVFPGDEELKVGGRVVTLRDVALRLVADPASISPEDLFGAMTVVSGHNEQGAFLVPVELRSVWNEEKTWNDVSTELDRLCVWSEEAYQRR